MGPSQVPNAPVAPVPGVVYTVTQPPPAPASMVQHYSATTVSMMSIPQLGIVNAPPQTGGGGLQPPPTPSGNHPLTAPPPFLRPPPTNSAIGKAFRYPRNLHLFFYITFTFTFYIITIRAQVAQ